jgi:hypothetical protein
VSEEHSAVTGFDTRLAELKRLQIAPLCAQVRAPPLPLRRALAVEFLRVRTAIVVSATTVNSDFRYFP